MVVNLSGTVRTSKPGPLTEQLAVGALLELTAAPRSDDPFQPVPLALFGLSGTGPWSSEEEILGALPGVMGLRKAA